MEPSIEELKIALKEAIWHVKEHNSDYHYITTPEKIEEWEKLVS